MQPRLHRPASRTPRKRFPITSAASCALLAAATASSIPAHAALTPSGDVSPSNLPTWTSQTEVYVGNTAMGTVTVDMKSILNSGNAFLGYLPGAVGSVNIADPGSAWTTSTLFLGHSGDGTIATTNGGQFNCTSSFVGYMTGSTGTVTVNGSGSTFASADLYVGYNGIGTLAISNGAKVTNNSFTYLGFKSGSAGTATIDGTGSTWVLTDTLHVGSSGPGALSITNGGMLSSTGLSVGHYSIGALSITNGGTATSTGGAKFGIYEGSIGTGTIDSPTSTWNLDGSLTVGMSGNGSLSIANGGRVTSNAAGYDWSVDYLGSSAGSAGTVTVGGTGSIWSSSSVRLGYFGHGVLVITGGGQVTSSGICHLGYFAGSTGTATIDGNASAWVIAKNLYVGGSGNGSLTINNGGRVTSGSPTDSLSAAKIGGASGSVGTVTINGTGSTWVSSSIHVGESGSGSLTVNNGGNVTSSMDCYLGYSGGSDGIVTIDGSGSTWVVSNRLYVGYYGSGRLAVTNGGQVKGKQPNTLGSIVTVGYGTGSVGTVTVDGMASAFIVASVNVGWEAKGALTITNGGNVTCSSVCIVGARPASTGSVTIDGTESRWTSPSPILVGYYGHGMVVISDGGKVTASDGHLGQYSGSFGAVTVQGAGSAWTSSAGLYVGYYGNGALVVAKSGIVTSTNGYLGYQSGSSGTATIDGAASTWTSSVGLYIGYSGKGTFAIAHSGIVNSSNGYLGFNAGSTGTAIIEGAGSTWASSSNLHVGYFGEGTLVIGEGGTVMVTGTTYVASNPGSSGTIDFGLNGGTLNTRTLWASPSQIKGTGTINTTALLTDGTLTFDSTHRLNQSFQWNSPGQNVTVNLDVSLGTDLLGVGYLATGSLLVKDGVAISSQTGSLGYRAGSTGGATLTGPGSSWNQAEDFFVGVSGAGAIALADGGKVSTRRHAYVGQNRGSTGIVTIDGPGSEWSVDYGVYVGHTGHGTLTISNGGKVRCNTVPLHGGSYLGYTRGSYGSVNVDGLGSAYQSDDGIYVGNYGRGSISITNGANVTSRHIYLGSKPASFGTVSVDASTLTLSGALIVGDSGQGALAISNGGSVSVEGNAYFARNAGATGVVHFGDGGGTLASGSIFALPSHVSGTGAIKTSGLVTDGNLVFDAMNGPTRTLSWNAPGQNVTVTVDLGLGGGDLGVGYIGEGSLSITDGVTINSHSGHLGFGSGAHGTATVLGSGSVWNLNRDLTVGRSGMGRLEITNGGKVTAEGYADLGYYAGSSGTVILDGKGSTFICSYLLNLGSSGEGSLYITNGASFTTYGAQLASAKGSTAIMTVDGPGSTWSSPNSLYIAWFGRASMAISNGGIVSSGGGNIGQASGSTGSAIIDGPGSLWTVNGQVLSVGSLGQGSLAIANGGKVTAISLSVAAASLLAINIGDSSLLSLDSGTLTNAGFIRFNAAAAASSGSVHTPIVATTWLGTGIVQPLGGTWNTSSHTFTVSQLATGSAGQPIDIDRSQIQRIHISHDNSGRQAFVNVLPSASTANLSLTAAPLTPAQSAVLHAAITPATSVLGGWTFAATGYAADPVYFSLSIGPGFKRNNLSLWRLSGDAWTTFSPIDFSYDGTFASFTDTGFAGYALTLAAIQGDINLDGKVDAFDLNALAAKWQQGSNAYWSDGDFNADGKIDAFDLNLLAANWQAGTPLELAPGATPIPEPASLALLGLGESSLAIRRRRAAYVGS